MKQEEAVLQRIKIGSHVTIIAGADLVNTERLSPDLMLDIAQS